MQTTRCQRYRKPTFLLPFPRPAPTRPLQAFRSKHTHVVVIRWQSARQPDVSESQLVQRDNDNLSSCSTAPACKLPNHEYRYLFRSGTVVTSQLAGRNVWKHNTIPVRLNVGPLHVQVGTYGQMAHCWQSIPHRSVQLSAFCSSYQR